MIQRVSDPLDDLVMDSNKSLKSIYKGSRRNGVRMAKRKNGKVKVNGTGATADVGWEKNTQDEGGHFYVRFINWGTIYRPPQEFIYATGREADAELQKIAEQEYQAYLDRTVG